MKAHFLSFGIIGILFSSAPVSAFAMSSTPMRGLTITVHGPTLPQSVPPGSQGVVMLTLDITNDDTKEASVETIRVLHRGLGDRADILGIYLVSSSRERLSDRFSFARDGLAELRIWPPLVIAAGTTQTVAIFADISPDAAIAGEHRLWVSSDANIDAGDTAVFVRQGVAQTGLVRTAGQDRSLIEVDYPGLNERVRYGENRLVGRIRLHAVGRDDQLISSLTLTNNGKARGDDLKKIFIESSRGQRMTNVVATLEGRSKNRAIITFDPPLQIDGGSSVILNVRANVFASRRRTIQFIVEEPGDIVSSVKGR